MVSPEVEAELTQEANAAELSVAAVEPPQSETKSNTEK